MDHEKDIDLDLCISKISRQDRAALEELYRAFSKPIYRFSLMMLRDPSLAEDAMQEAFIRIMSYSGTYKLGTNARAWIFRIARNSCLDVAEKRIPTGDGDEAERVPHDGGIESVATAVAVEDAVAKLTPAEREILSLHIYSGLKQTEIAKVLGISYVKVRSHYKYAIQKLRKELGENER